MTAQVDTQSQRQEHRRFLDRYYGISHTFYDFTRKYYLFGRDTVLERLLREEWGSLLDVGVGTGRNLIKLHDRRPAAQYGGIEVARPMLEKARARCPWAKLQEGFAEDAPLATLLGHRPERILFSYVMTMVQDPRAALENARRAVGPTGLVHVVDFGDMTGLPAVAREAMNEWLRTFHVTYVPASLYEEAGGKVEWGRFRYWFHAVIPGL